MNPLNWLTPLRCEQIDEGTWILTDELHYLSARIGEIIVPAAFATDFASVPRLPLAYLLAGGVGDRAAVIHDFLYRSVPHPTDRATADAVFYDALIDCGISSWRAYLMWSAVRCFGRGNWR